jgi:ketosteroid isomerase-like protein
MASQQKHMVLEAVQAANQRWKTSFNTGNSAGCAAEYEKDASMSAQPFGLYNGRDEVQGFWQKLMDDGFTDAHIVDPKIEVIDDRSAVLSSKTKWKMNKAQGVIHKKLWVIQADGSAKLREDNFEFN